MTAEIAQVTLTIEKLLWLVVLFLAIQAPCHLLDSFAIRHYDGCQLETEQLEQLMTIASVEHVEDDDESYLVGQRKVVAHREYVLLDVDATVAEPSDAARVGLELSILLSNDCILFTEFMRKVNLCKST